MLHTIVFVVLLDFGRIEISMVVGMAHIPAFGVKVYTVVAATAVLIVAGDQAPVIAGLLVEPDGKTGAKLF